MTDDRAKRLLLAVFAAAPAIVGALVGASLGGAGGALFLGLVIGGVPLFALGALLSGSLAVATVLPRAGVVAGATVVFALLIGAAAADDAQAAIAYFWFPIVQGVAAAIRRPPRGAA